ncbi:MAG: hypothetical protein IJL92_07810, partial [Thermoguttaceae bacterium]|nr:hypothetical protein [Thermoguttaceae bacterium]
CVRRISIMKNLVVFNSFKEARDDSARAKRRFRPCAPRSFRTASRANIPTSAKDSGSAEA